MKQRVNRPETAAAVLVHLSGQARNVTALFFLFGVTMATLGLWPYGLAVVVMGVCLTGAISAIVYLAALRVLVLNWHEIQFYRPTPRTKMRKVPFYTRRGVQDLEVVDRVGG